MASTQVTERRKFAYRRRQLPVPLRNLRPDGVAQLILRVRRHGVLAVLAGEQKPQDQPFTDMSAFYDALVKALVDAHAEGEDEGEDEAAAEMEIDADKASQKTSS
jgi:hypothetical protein